MLKPLATGDGRLLAGDTARFRNGLFDGKLGVREGDSCRSESGQDHVVSANGAKQSNVCPTLLPGGRVQSASV